jgi:hypothetical protein
MKAIEQQRSAQGSGVGGRGGGGGGVDGESSEYIIFHSKHI